MAATPLIPFEGTPAPSPARIQKITTETTRQRSLRCFVGIAKEVGQRCCWMLAHLLLELQESQYAQ